MPNVTGIYIPDGVEGDAVRGMMLNDFGIEIGTSFGPLHGKIWRIGTMGYVCRKENVLICLAALEACLRKFGFSARPARRRCGARGLRQRRSDYAAFFAVALSISAISPLSNSIGRGGQPLICRSTGMTCSTEPTTA